MSRLRRLARRSSGVQVLSFRTIFEHSLEAITFVDPRSGLVLDANRAACALYGCTREELIGTSAQSRARSASPAFYPIPDPRGGAPARHFFTLDRTLAGSTLHLEVNASLVRRRGRELVVAFHRDLTEKASMARKLADAGGEWQLTIDSIQEAILTVDLSGRFIRVNEMAASMAGETSGIVKRKLSDFGATEPWARAADLVAFVAEHGIALSSQVDEPFSGTTWDVVATPVNSASEAKRVILVLRDVTLMVSLEESLRRSETMAEMGQLVSGVAHEVRNPLFTISATLDALEKQMPAGELTVGKPYLQHLREAIGRLTSLMRELLELGRPPSLQVSTEPLSNAITDAIADVTALAKVKNIGLINEAATVPARVLMDRSKLAQALSNLLENAIHHSPLDESILVSAQLSQVGAQSWVICKIEDRGAGFAEADLPHLFEPFFSRRTGGTGLGLAIVRRIVEHHGGRVIASNRAGGGACFTVMIPHLSDGDMD